MELDLQVELRVWFPKAQHDRRPPADLNGTGIEQQSVAFAAGGLLHGSTEGNSGEPFRGWIITGSFGRELDPRRYISDLYALHVVNIFFPVCEEGIFLSSYPLTELNTDPMIPAIPPLRGAGAFC